MCRALALLALAGCYDGPKPFVEPVKIDAREIDAPTIDGPPPDASTLGIGLVAWYRMDTLVVPTVVDASGNNQTGTCASCPVVMTPGKIGAAYDFTTDRIDVPNSSILQTTSTFSIAFWVRFDAPPASGNACPIGKGRHGGNVGSYQLCFQQSPAAWAFYTFNGGIDLVTSTPAPLLNTWHHVVLWWNGTTKQLWIDGMMRTTKAHTNIMFDAFEVNLGGDVDNAPGGPGAFIDGQLDDVRIYNRALTLAEIALLANP